MGITIEKADKTLLEFYHYIKGDVHFCGYNEDDVLTTIDFVRNIMRKYQTIVHIMERTVDDGTSMYDTLQEIEEVIEDGNDR